jgi:hypothetical protein
MWYVLWEFMWSSKRPSSTSDESTQQEAITSQQPEAVATQQLEAITYQPDPSADMLIAKTLFAGEIISANKSWVEKEVSLIIIYNVLYGFIPVFTGTGTD